MENTKSLVLGESYKVTDIKGNSDIEKRLNSLGILKNSVIYIYKRAPLGDPIIIKINNSIIAIRKKLLNNLILDKI